MKFDLIEEHYIANRQKLVKRMTFLSGSPEAGEDIVQEAYSRALKYFNSYDGRALNHWINRIVHTCLIDYKNEENGHPQDGLAEFEEIPIPCPSYPDHIMREVYELIDTKSPVQIEVLTMHFRHEYAAIDISKITEYSYAQCHKIISRFREELRQLYKE